MKPAGDPNSFSSNQPKRDFNVTIIDSRLLPERLAAELQRVIRELRDVLPELRRDPLGVGRRLLSRSAMAVRRWREQPDLMVGHASGLLVIVSVILLVITVGGNNTNEGQTTHVLDDSPDEVVMLEGSPTAEPTGTGYDPRAKGRVGLRLEKGEGSASTRTRAQGGGTGGMGDNAPAQKGKVPPSSVIPAAIPKHPPINSPALPRAGIDIDPLLWTDVKYPAYGIPNSKSVIPSNGPGHGGGMGSNEGAGIGDGKGNGYGSGSGGNTGGGEKQLGSNGGGGAPAGQGGYERVVHTGEVEQKVRLLSKPEPQYSEEARRTGISGTVVLRVVFTSAGEVTQIRAINTLPFGLTERAIAAARQIKFLPAMKGGRAVSVHMQLEYNFNLY
jgi:TonB family protein